MVTAKDVGLADRVRAWLNEGKLRGCPACGGKRINVARLVTVAAYDPATDWAAEGGRHVPMAQVRCEDCCCLLHYDLQAMGLLAPVPEEPTPDAN